MARAKVLNIEKIQSSLRIMLDKFVSSKKVLDQIGEFSRDRIYSFAKSGKSLFGDDPKKFMSLSRGYINYRKKLEQTSQMGDLFSPSRSNLTLTGQMLDALKYKIKSGSAMVEVFVEASARNDTPQLTKRPKKGPRLNNAQVAESLAKRGRKFIGMDRLGRDRIKKLIIKELRIALRSRR